MFGRRAKLPFERQTPVELNDVDTIDQDTMNGLIKMRESLNSTASNNIIKAQIRQKRNYDRRQAPNQPFEIGTVVYMKNRKRIHRMGGKLTPLFQGPYTVVKCLDKGLVQIQNKQGKFFKKSYNQSILKRYPDDSDSPDEPEDIMAPGEKETEMEHSDNGDDLNMDWIFDDIDGSDVEVDQNVQCQPKKFNPLPATYRLPS